MIETTIDGVPLRFETAPSLFSPKAVDRGTLFMLASTTFAPADRVLDLGCGYGVVGIYAAKRLKPEQVHMIDNDPVAVEFAASNATLNGVEGVSVVLGDGYAGLTESTFDKILCNPPYHTDFSVAKRFIEKGFNRLGIGGAMIMVTKRDTWYRNKLTAVFGGVRVKTSDGYFVFEAVKKSNTYANKR